MLQWQGRRSTHWYVVSRLPSKKCTHGYLPELSWGDSIRSVEIGWHVSSRDSSRHWQNYTSHHRFLETLLLSMTYCHSVWSSLQDLGQLAPPGTHKTLRSGHSPGPVSTFPSLLAWAEAGNTLLLHITNCSPERHIHYCAQLRKRHCYNVPLNVSGYSG